MPAAGDDGGPARKGPADKDEAPLYLGHRDRLRQRFAAAGGDALPDYELLELILFRAIPRRDVKDDAKRLIQRFGSLAEVIAAPESRLRDEAGLSDGVITDLKVIQAAARRLTKGDMTRRALLSNSAAVIAYCRTAMAFAEREIFRVLFLDKRNGLIADEIQQSGTVDHTPVYPREIVKRALELSATALILVHNHPSGDPTPSQADVTMTRNIAEIATSLGIHVHDHIIVGRDGHRSFRAMQLL